MANLNSGMSLRYVAKQYKIPSRTVMTWTMRKNHPELNTGKKRGRPKEKDLTKENWKERYEILKNTKPSLRHNERESNIYKFI